MRVRPEDRSRVVTLSDTQINALAELDNVRAADHFTAQMLVGRRYRRTLDVLERAGLVRYFPYGDNGHGTWALTPNGRARVKQLIADGKLFVETVVK